MGVKPDPDEEEIEDMVLNDERERNLRIIFEDNNGGVNGTKALLHAKKWDVCNLEKDVLVKGGYSVKVADKDGKEVIWEFFDNHVVEEGVEHEEIGLQDLNLIYSIKRGRYVLGTM